MCLDCWADYRDQDGTIVPDKMRFPEYVRYVCNVLVGVCINYPFQTMYVLPLLAETTAPPCTVDYTILVYYVTSGMLTC